MKKNKVKWFKKKLQSSYLNIIGQRFSVPSMTSNSNVSHSARESVVEDVFKWPCCSFFLILFRGHCLLSFRVVLGPPLVSQTELRVWRTYSVRTKCHLFLGGFPLLNFMFHECRELEFPSSVYPQSLVHSWCLKAVVGWIHLCHRIMLHKWRRIVWGEPLTVSQNPCTDSCVFSGTSTQAISETYSGNQ